MRGLAKYAVVAFIAGVSASACSVDPDTSDGPGAAPDAGGGVPGEAQEDGSGGSGGRVAPGPADTPDPADVPGAPDVPPDGQPDVPDPPDVPNPDEPPTPPDVPELPDFANGNPGVIWAQAGLDAFEMRSAWFSTPMYDSANVEIFVELENVSDAPVVAPRVALRFEDADEGGIVETENGAFAGYARDFRVSGDIVVGMVPPGGAVVAWGFPTLGLPENHGRVARVICTVESAEISGMGESGVRLEISEVAEDLDEIDQPIVRGVIENTGTATAYELDIVAYLRGAHGAPMAKASLALEDNELDSGVALEPGESRAWATYGADRPFDAIDPNLVFVDYELAPF